MPSAIAVVHTGPVAEIRLCRGDAGNPVDATLLLELEAACAELDGDGTSRVVLLTAEGPGFSTGGDDRTPGDFRFIELIGLPVIAVIEGGAAGAGFELALACDMRVAAAGVVFSLPQVAAGTIPSHGGTQRLTRLAGPGIAAEMLLAGEVLDAERALACGVVNAVVPAGEVRARAEAIAASICARGPLAVRYAKEAISRGLDMPLDQALRYESDLTVILQTTGDRAEGVRAFLEKRPPVFRGE